LMSFFHSFFLCIWL